MNTLRTIQEVFFDISDLINSGQINDTQIKGFSEFETLREFMLEQHRKLQIIEKDLLMKG